MVLEIAFLVKILKRNLKFIRPILSLQQQFSLFRNKELFEKKEDEENKDYSPFPWES